MATTSSGSAAAEIETAPEAARPPRKTSLLPLTGALFAASWEKLRASCERALYASALWRQALSGPAPDRLLAQPRSFFPKSLIEAERILSGRRLSE